MTLGNLQNIIEQDAKTQSLLPNHLPHYDSAVLLSLVILTALALRLRFRRETAL